jgi:hypothetical protein
VVGEAGAWRDVGDCGAFPVGGGGPDDLGRGGGGPARPPGARGGWVWAGGEAARGGDAALGDGGGG